MDENGLPSLAEIEKLIKADNGGYYSTSVGAIGYVNFNITKYHKKDSILARFFEKNNNKNKRQLQIQRSIVVFCYAHNLFIDLGKGDGAIQIDHVDENRTNDEPANLRACPAMFNSMLKAKAGKGITKKKTGSRWQYNIPLHTTFIDSYKYVDAEGNRKNKKEKNKSNPNYRRFRQFWKKKDLRMPSEGKKLLSLGYGSNTSAMDRSQYSKKAAARRRKNQARAVLAFFRAHWRACFPSWQDVPTLDLENIFQSIEKNMKLLKTNKRKFDETSSSIKC